jgi:hypothetical protein
MEYKKSGVLKQDPGSFICKRMFLEKEQWKKRSEKGKDCVELRKSGVDHCVCLNIVSL